MGAITIRVYMVDGYGESGYNDYFDKSFDSKSEMENYISENESHAWFGTWETVVHVKSKGHIGFQKDAVIY